MTTTATNTPTPELSGGALKRQLARAMRRQKIRALLLTAPLLAFIILGFLMPIGSMLMRSVDNSIVEETMPRTVAALESWDVTSTEIPSEEVFTALAADLQIAVENRSALVFARRMNYELAGFTTMVRRAQRAVRSWDIENDGPFREQFIEAHAGWGELEHIRRRSPPATIWPPSTTR